MTGHEEIYAWLDHANDTARMEATARAVMAYVGVAPHWALAGSARRWWCVDARHPFPPSLACMPHACMHARFNGVHCPDY